MTIFTKKNENMCQKMDKTLAHKIPFIYLKWLLSYTHSNNNENNRVCVSISHGKKRHMLEITIKIRLFILYLLLYYHAFEGYIHLTFKYNLYSI